MRILIVLISIFLFGCATYQNKVYESRNLIKQGQVSAALEKLKALAETPSDDQLVYLLDYGTALQIAGLYKESNEVFLKADKLFDINDFHSISNLTAATLGSESMIQYKGESYEKVLINAFLAINFLMLNQNDSALVEVRRLNEKLTKMNLDGRQPYELNPFAKYLSALIWESDQKFDDAYIAFEQSYKLDATNPFIAEDLIRSSKNARREDTHKKWRSEFPQINENPDWYSKSKGELVLIYQQGWGPEKHMAPGEHRFPALYPVRSETRSMRLTVENQTYATQVIYNVEQVAIQTLREDYGALVARRMGGIVAKAVVADQIRQKNELLGHVAWIAMNIADQADLRQWSTLPETIQMVKILLPPGKYKIQLQGLNSGGGNTADFHEAEVTISSRKKTFYNYRSLR
jgi:hypothetical protein